MFKRKSYLNLGGHEAVKNTFVEDLPLANLCLSKGKKYSIYHTHPLYSVRMYETLGDFINGWRRNFRAGLIDSTLFSSLEIALFIAAITGCGFFWQQPVLGFVSLGTLVFLGNIQKSLGTFSWFGILFFPFSLGLFVFVTLLAIVDMTWKKPQNWKDRSLTPVQH